MPGNGVPGESMVKFGPLAGRRYPGQAKLPHRRRYVQDVPQVGSRVSFLWHVCLWLRGATVRMNGYWKSLLVSVIVVTMPNPRAVPQSAADTATLRAATARNDLIQSFQAENKRGTSIFYTQAYRLHGRRVEFHGSIFGEILEVQVDGCELKIKSQLVDLYSGSIGAELVGQTQNRYTTSVDFPLTDRKSVV